ADSLARESVVQRRVPLSYRCFPLMDGSRTSAQFLVDQAPYLFRGRMGGFLTRLSTGPLANVTAGGSMIWGYPPAPHSRAEKSGAQVTLELLCREIYKKTILHCLPERGPDGFRHMITLLLTPPIARSLADGGYSKQDVRDYLYENARVTRRELEWHTRFSFAQDFTIEEKVKQGLFPEEFLVGDDELVRLLPSPDILHLIVCGEPGRNRLMGFHSVYVKPTTKAVELPRNWDSLVADCGC
ncbi:MAG: hypothetical protein QF491_14590, partial [Alphaproteobacteria bacterium]|nr:hypothetical protein [Alphaproteobacteria bacterium]